MKKIYTTLAMALVFTIASFAQMIPQGSMVPYSGMKRNVANFIKDEGDVLVSLPETAVVEDDWAIDAIYNYGENNVPYINDNPISVAYDGNDIYFRGVVYTCPEAWIKGRFADNVASFPNGQFCGVYNGYNIYACGTSDAVSFGNILFQYDPEAQTFTLANIYLENTYPDQQGFIFFSYRMVLTKKIQVPVPTDLTVVPDVDKAQVSWTSESSNHKLRYRKVVDLTGSNRLWDFEDEDQVSEFTIVDDDGDGNGWTWLNTQVKAHSGAGIMYSMSYDNSLGALTPDNWLITPMVKLGGQVSFWACSQEQSASYASENFQVYVCEADEWTSLNDFVEVSPIYTTTVDYQQYTCDLSNYQGNGYIAIRHFNCTDQFWLDIDDLEVLVPEASGDVQEEWIEVADVTSPYTIENLEPETEYEVQVRALDGDAASPWTASVVFTTFAQGATEPTIDELYLVGSFNGWNWQNAEGRVPLELENDAFTVTIDLTNGTEFKLITPDETSSNGWKWFGGVDDNNVGFFLINDDLLDQPIGLVDGSNFKVEGDGKYTISVTSAVIPESISPKAVKEPLVMVVTKIPTAITAIDNDMRGDNTWYNLQGVKLNGKPTAPGIYINGGRKVVIK